MHGRHHIYNFHIGFWGAFLVSLMVMAQSALFLVFSSAVTLAQTAPFVSLSSPTSGQQVLQGVPFVFTAQTQSAPSQPVRFFVKDLSTQFTTPFTGQSTDPINWSFQWLSPSVANYEVFAQTTDTQGTTQITPTVLFSVVTAIQVVVGLDVPTSGMTITTPLEFQATTNVAVDTLEFILTPSSGGTEIVRSATRNTNNPMSWTSTIDPNSMPAGQYNVVAKATLSGQTQQSSQTSVTVAPQVQPTINVTVPTNNQQLANSFTFIATTNVDATSVSFQITDQSSVIVQLLQAIQEPSNPLVWTASFNTNTIPNGTYSLVSFATFAGQTLPVISQNLSITIANVVPTTPLAIQTQTLSAGTVGVLYNSGLLVATGGKLPYSWSIPAGALPAGLSLQNSNDNATIAGIPTTSGTINITIQVKDADNTTKQQGYSLVINAAPTAPTVPTAPTTPTTTDPTAPTAPTTPTVAPGVTISQPLANATLAGGNVLVVVTGTVALTAPEIRLLSSAGLNVLAGKNAVAVLSINNDGRKIWNYVLNTISIPNGNYKLQTVTRAEGGIGTMTSSDVSVTISNTAAVEQNVVSGGILAPTAGQRVSGKVLMQAQLKGNVRSVTFRVTTSNGATQVVPALPDLTRVSDGIWQAVWDATTAVPGGTAIKAEAVSAEGETKTLGSVTVNMIAQTTPLAVIAPPVPNDIPPATIEQIVEPRVLQNIDPNGTVSVMPVECVIVDIRDEARCKDYLKTREIRILSTAEQQQVRTDLAPIVSRHIEVSGGQIFKVDPAVPGQPDRQNLLQDPLSEIIPIDRKTATLTSLLVVTSTEPPSNIRPFVEQTVPAVLTFDQDGDGLTDEAETRYGTDPRKADSDGDGYTDGEEVKNNFNPLGAGVLEQQVAPMDKAILNNRPVEQPRFAGVVDRENIVVQTVASDKTSEEQIRFSGKAEARSFVTLFIYSSLPIVVTVQTDDSGNWEYDFSHPLVDGKHDVYATVTNDTGKIVKKSEPFSFFVRAAYAVEEDEFLQTSSVQDTSNIFLLYYVFAGLLIVALSGGLFFYYLRQREHFI